MEEIFMDNVLNTQSIVNTALTAAQEAARYLPEPIASGVDFATSFARARGNEMTVKLDPTYEKLINRQIEAQEQMQQASFLSNIERSKHEIAMAPIRNIRLG